MPESPGTPSAANIQGALHVPGYMGGECERRRRKRKIRKEAAKTLYVHRSVLNHEQIIAWARSVGFTTVYAPEELHVTIAYSKTPVDWDSISPDTRELIVPAADQQIDGSRSITQLGEQHDATVLRFESSALAQRWRQLLDLGASWDWDIYRPHITISQNAPHEAVLWPPYRGPIQFGPEVFAEITENAMADAVEKASGFPKLTRHGESKIADDTITFSWLTSVGRSATSSMPLLSPQDIVYKVRDRMARFQKAGPSSRESDSTRFERKYISAHDDATLRKAWALGDGAVRAEMRMMFDPDSHSGINDPDWLEKNTKPTGTVIGDDGAALSNSSLMKSQWADDIMEKIGARHSKADTQMIQQMHDHAVKLGATCNGLNGYEQSDKDVEKFKIAKVDESLGLVFGYAIISKVNGEDYYDLNRDPTGNVVPEHIPENTMLKAAADFMQNSRMGNEMHSGPDAGTYVFAMPWTTDIAKAFGVDNPRVTGLMVAYKPPKDVLAKFLDGTYKGFSIEGKRISVQEIE